LPSRAAVIFNDEALIAATSAIAVPVAPPPFSAI